MKFAKILLALWLAGGAELAVAGGFADSFRDFIVGSEAQARPTSDTALDKAVGECLGCHNGSAATHINARSAGTVAPTHGFQTLDHPVGMLYEQSMRKDPRSYRPAVSLHPNIQLVDGKVACVSCHQLKKAMPDLAPERLASAQPQCTASRELTTGPRDKELCLACHVK